MIKSPVKYAFQPSTGRGIYIEDAENGLRCQCICTKCGDKMEAVQGDVRDWHYRHYVDRGCDGAWMTLLHLMAQQILLESDSVFVSKGVGRLRYSGPVKEVRIGAYRADVTVLAGEETVYFEIFVTSGCDKEKDRYYRDNRHKAVEIDLSTVDPAIPLPDLRKLVLKDRENRRIIFWLDDEPREPISVETVLAPARDAGEWIIAVVLGAIILILCWPKKRRRRRHR